MLTVPSVSAQTSDTIEGGRTTIWLSSTFVDAVGSLGVTPGTVSPASLSNGVVDLPVSSGVVELGNARAQILHSGGLTVTSGKTVVALDSFIIDTTGSMPVITGLVVADGTLLGRVTLFDLTAPSGLTLPLDPHNGELTLDSVGVTLDASAASALNSVFHNTFFAKGLEIGTANVVVMLSPIS
jgi:hypothetical protein